MVSLIFMMNCSTADRDECALLALLQMMCIERGQTKNVPNSLQITSSLTQSACLG